jgi:hypothetical protein
MMKDELIERLVKSNQREPIVVLKLNKSLLQKVDFSELSSTL